MSKFFVTIMLGMCLAVAAFATYRYYTKDMELAEFIVKYDKFQADAAKVIKWADSIVIAAAKKDSVIAAQEVVVDRLKKSDVVIASTNKKLMSKADSLKAAALLIKDKDSLIVNQSETIVVLTTVVANDSIRFVAKDSVITFRNRQLEMAKASAASYKWRGDSLQKVLDGRPITPLAPTKIFNIIPLPSRSTAFLMGIATGLFVVNKL